MSEEGYNNDNKYFTCLIARSGTGRALRQLKFLKLSCLASFVFKSQKSNLIRQMTIPTITAYTAKDFRSWLKKYHKKGKRVAVILHKRHTGKPAPNHRELIEEAICFGWIDTTLKRLDENTYLRNFAKRTPNSKWSYNTLKYAKQMLKDGRMTPEGMHYYKLGLKKPTHDHGIPSNPEIPPELKKALLKNKKALNNFDEFPPSTKKTFYRWLLHAKLPETHNKRVKQIVKSAVSKNNPFRPIEKTNN